MRFKKIIFILIIFFLGIDNKIIIAKKDLKKLNKVIKEKNLANSYCAFSHSMCKDGWNWVNYSDMENRLKVDFFEGQKDQVCFSLDNLKALLNAYKKFNLKELKLILELEELDEIEKLIENMDYATPFVEKLFSGCTLLLSDLKLVAINDFSKKVKLCHFQKKIAPLCGVLYCKQDKAKNLGKNLVCSDDMHVVRTKPRRNYPSFVPTGLAISALNNDKPVSIKKTGQRYKQNPFKLHSYTKFTTPQLDS